MIPSRYAAAAGRVIPFRRSIAARFAALMVAVTIAFFLIVEAFDAYRIFQEGRAGIERSHEDAVAAHATSMAANAWYFERTQLALQLNGILSDPLIDYAEIRQSGAAPIEAGDPAVAEPRTTTVALTHVIDKTIKDVGTLTLVSDLRPSREAAWFEAVEGIAKSLLLSLVLAGALLAAFQLLVTRHLDALKHYIATGGLKVADGESASSPDPAPDGATDEIGQVRAAFDELQQALREASEDLMEALQRAERASEAKSEFLATMSHEFRTPLNAILGYSEVMQQELFGPIGVEAYRDYVGNIHGSGRHMLGLVTQILDLTAMENGERELIRARASVVACLEKAVETLAPFATQRDVTLSIKTVGDAGIEASIDTGAFEQACVNVLHNAIKFSHPGDTVEIEPRRTVAGVAVAIRDRGVGIPADRLDAVLQPFNQASKDPTVFQDGLGLGLTIARMLMRAHDGDLAIESAEGAGTTITLTLPA